MDYADFKAILSKTMEWSVMPIPALKDWETFVRYIQPGLRNFKTMAFSNTKNVLCYVNEPFKKALS